MQLGKLSTTPRGFQYLSFEDANGIGCSLQQSSAIGDGEGAMQNPGSSFVWLGRDGRIGDDDDRMHLDRKQVRALVKHLRCWLKTGELTPNPEPQP